MRKISQEKFEDVITLFKFHIPPKIIASATKISYTNVIGLQRGLLFTHLRLTPSQILEHLRPLNLEEKKATDTDTDTKMDMDTDTDTDF